MHRISPRQPLSLAVVAALALTGAVSRTAVAGTLVVANCDDSGPGSLRDTIGNAASGETIDLGQLECGTITLAGAIDVPLDDLALAGPASGALVIDADQVGRAFAHAGTGLLSIASLAIVNGVASGGAIARGGCIDSAGSVSLTDVVVSGCHAVAASAAGGAVSVEHSLELVRSRLSGNIAYANIGSASGGAAYVLEELDMLDSVVEGNYVQALPVAGDTAAVGGGLFLYGGDFRIVGSTISNNSADVAGGIEVRSTLGGDDNLIANSTIAGNSASTRIGGIHVGRATTMVHVTIAGNSAPQPPGTLGIAVGAQVDPNIVLTVQSALIAGNHAGTVVLDLGGDSGICVGSHSLIPTSSIEVPPDTLMLDPLLGPLADNGGPTRTMALSPGSPAIDTGTNPTALAWDQRGTGFARVAGLEADIGAFEYTDVIFANSFD
jgi:hypothetical protein